MADHAEQIARQIAEQIADAQAAPRILPAGEDAFLVEFPPHPPSAEPYSAEPYSAVSPVSGCVLPFTRAARGPDRPAGVVEVIPAARTVLVAFDPSIADSPTIAAWCTGLARRVAEAGGEGSGTGVGLGAGRGFFAAPAGPSATETAATGPAAAGTAAAETTVLPVVYDGPDLDAVGKATGLGRAGVIAAHTSGAWTVAFTGFAPGFGYLVGGDPRLRVARRDTPRTRVPAGSVGLADAFSGVYPKESPGGWQLIGRTAVALWRPGLEAPALLRPGMRVRFVEEAP